MLAMKKVAFITRKKKLNEMRPIVLVAALVRLEMTPTNTNSSAEQENRTERNR